MDCSGPWLNFTWDPYFIFILIALSSIYALCFPVAPSSLDSSRHVGLSSSSDPLPIVVYCWFFPCCHSRWVCSIVFVVSTCCHAFCTMPNPPRSILGRLLYSPPPHPVLLYPPRWIVTCSYSFPLSCVLALQFAVLLMLCCCLQLCCCASWCNCCCRVATVVVDL